jgi:MraZ protein
MTQFLGTHIGKLDRKGRISVPAGFRAALERIGSEEIILRPSHILPCIEVYPRPAFERLAAGIERLDVFSEQYEALAAVLYADTYPSQPDGDGRLVLPEPLIAHAGLGETITVVGNGAHFQIWEPEAAKRRAAEARLRARERGMTLPAAPPAAPPIAGNSPSPLNTTPVPVP